MEFLVNEEDLGRLIMGYLRDRGAFETLSSFQLESGLCEGRLGDDLLYIQKLVLQGRWEEVDDFLQPLKEKLGFTSKINYLILKQKFLESLSYQGAGGQRIAFPPWKPPSNAAGNDKSDLVQKEVIFSQLIALQSLCSSEEFNSLCLCLTLEKLEDHEDYQEWTIAKGRIDCFRDLRNMLCAVLPGPNDPDLSSEQFGGSNGLQRTLAMSLAYQCSQDAPSNKTYFHPQLGQVVPASFNQHSHVSAPSVVLASHIRYLKRFDAARLKPSLGDRPTSAAPSSAHAAVAPARPKSTFLTEPPQLNASNNVFSFSGGVAGRRPSSSSYQEETTKAPVFWLPGDREPPPAAPGRGEGLPPQVGGGGEPLSARPAAVVVVVEETPAAKPMPANLRRKMQAAETRTASSDAADEDVRHSSAAPIPQQSAARPVSRGGKPAAAPVVAVAAEESKYAYQQPPVQQVQLQQQPEPARERPVSTKSSSNSVHSGSTASKATAASGPAPSKLPQRKVDPEPQTNPAGFPNIKENSSVKSGPASAPKPSNEGASVASGASQASQRPAAAVSVQPGKHLLYHTSGDAPVRCVSILEQPSSSSGGGSDSRATTHLALGTNDQCIHFLKYDKSAIAHEFGGVPSGTYCDASALVARTGSLIEAHRGSVYAMDVHREYRLVATGSNDKLLKISSVDRCEVLKVLKGHNGTIRVVRFQPVYNPKAPTALVVSAGAGDNAPRVWDLNTGTCALVCTAHPSAVHGLVWLSLTSFITGCEGGLIMHHDVSSPDMRVTFNLSQKVQQRERDLGIASSGQGLKRGVCCLALINPDSAHRPTDPKAATPVVAGCESGFLTIFDAYSGRILCNNRIHQEDIRSVSVRFQTMTLLTSSYDSSAALWTIQYNARESMFDLIPLAKLVGGHGSNKLLSAALVPHSRDVVTSASDGTVVLWTM